MVNVCMVIFSVFSHTLFGDILLNSVLVKITDGFLENNLPSVF